MESNNNLTDQGELLSISEGELYNKISDAFHALLSGLTPSERSKEIELLIQEFPVTEPPNQEASIKPVLPGIKPKTFRAILKSDLQLFQHLLNFAGQMRLFIRFCFFFLI